MNRLDWLMRLPRPSVFLFSHLYLTRKVAL